MLPDFRVRQRDYLWEITRTITEALDLETVLQRILIAATELLASSAGIIALRDEDRGWFIASSKGLQEGITKRLNRLLADVPNHGDPLRFGLPEVNRRLKRLTEAASMGLLTGTGLPMITQEEVVGVIFIFRSYAGGFSPEEQEMLSPFAAQAAIAVQNARFYTEISHQKQHLETVLESSADGIFLLNSRYQFIRFNRACSRLLGYPEQEVLGKHHREVIQWVERQPGPTLEDAQPGGWPLIHHGPIYVEGEARRHDGTTISLGITYAPTLTSEGRLLSIVANVRDITKFREAEELKSTFISIISHELRTPVALIKGYVGTLRREDAKWDPEVVGESLKVIEEEADRLSNLINDLLDASRLQSGAMTLAKHEVDLHNLLQKLVERHRTQSQQHQFELGIPDPLPTISGDEDRLSQVVSNLLSNALKYSPEGGTIRTSAHPMEEGVVICVKDEGPGIAPPDKQRIFDRFYRSPETADKTQGAGLGLFLAKAVVEAHGGQIWVDDSIREGAQICFYLPAQGKSINKNQLNPIGNLKEDDL